MTWFPTCSTCQSRSQALLCHCTLRLVSNQAERTFVRLRYNLGGDRPSQTPHQTVSPRFAGVRQPTQPGWYFKVDSTTTGAAVSKSPTYPTQDASNVTAKLE
jgi:hypothetical protein